MSNNKTLTALVAISAIAAILTASVHMAFAQLGSAAANPAQDTKTITKTTTNSGVNSAQDTDQKNDCLTAGGSSGISGSCQATSTSSNTESGGVLKK